METSNVNQKLAGFMAEMLCEDVKKFNYSPQDIIELYCVVREKEDFFLQRKKQLFETSKFLSVKLRVLGELKTHLSEVYILLTQDKTARDKLECWFDKYLQKKNAKNQPKVIPSASMQNKKSDASSKVSQLLVGMKKDETLQAIYRQLSSEGVWRGKLQASQVSETDMKKFFFILSLDKHWFHLLEKNRYVFVDCEQRLKLLNNNWSFLRNYFNFNFHVDVAQEFEKWKNSVQSVLKFDVSLIQKVIACARSKNELLSACNDFNNFWKRVLIWDASMSCFNLTSMLGYGVEPVEKRKVLSLLDLLKQNNLDAKNQLLEIIQHAGIENIALEAEYFPFLIQEIKKMSQVKRIVLFMHKSSKEGAFVLSCE